ncbi:DUF222 domain-containing protein [Arthrobacter humicola]|uniref:DUF222 domain-containing protein n=1 Tax=Arthrobacter humicola TaxID=409291 RepID=UPI001FAC72BC|nr:DUF222 domain-containing protein [Arthrobacter humicola]MCI9872391.1 DUF222 domain-containing protein [Arthrobacter humicola]
MEAIGEFIPDRAPWAGPAVSSRHPRLAAVPGAADAAGGALGAAVETALAALRASSPTADVDAAWFGLREAADFAGHVEDLSRTVEYFQLVAAAAVERTRQQAVFTAPAAHGWGEEAAQAGWLTGWKQESDGGTDAGAGGGADAVSDAGAHGVPVGGTLAGAGPGPRGDLAGHMGMSAAADDGYRNATDFLRARLRISAAEAKRRLTLAAELLPRAGSGGHTGPPVRKELAAAVAAGEVASRAATVITLALDRVRHSCLPEAAATMEHALTVTAIENDADFLARIARRWAEALDQDGAEPSEELLRRIQGAFLRKPRHGLQHLEIFATADQFEHLVTVMNTATNPRSGPDTGEGTATGHTAQAGPGDGSEAADEPGPSDEPATAEQHAALPSLDLRSRPQRLLDGLVGACKAALATGGLPAAGGLRPQVMATIDYRDLLTRLGTTPAEAGAPANTAQHGTGTRHGTGTLLFTGPVTASTVRKIACDADIIPVVLGGEGQVLDIGRASRVFPPHIRKAITARDRGCAFPQCTIPASWCEAHHITYWSRGGTTGTGNGTLLCSHHHHVIHKEHWSIQMRTGIPWFIPPPHLDPARTPRRNSYFRLE